jgi:hypothetical protein
MLYDLEDNIDKFIIRYSSGMTLSSRPYKDVSRLCCELLCVRNYPPITDGEPVRQLLLLRECN